MVHLPCRSLRVLRFGPLQVSPGLKNLPSDPVLPRGVATPAGRRGQGAFRGGAAVGRTALCLFPRPGGRSPANGALKQTLPGRSGGRSAPWQPLPHTPSFKSSSGLPGSRGGPHFYRRGDRGSGRQKDPPRGARPACAVGLAAAQDTLWPLQGFLSSPPPRPPSPDGATRKVGVPARQPRRHGTVVAGHPCVRPRTLPQVTALAGSC